MPWYHYRMSGLVFGDDPDVCLDALHGITSCTSGVVRVKRVEVGDAVEVKG